MYKFSMFMHRDRKVEMSEGKLESEVAMPHSPSSTRLCS